jgi:hypothetical protein
MPFCCDRCWVHFDTNEALEAHQEAPLGGQCTIKEGERPKGITPDVESSVRIKSRVKRNHTESEKWNAIYGLLFPGETVPTPCE